MTGAVVPRRARTTYCVPGTTNAIPSSRVRDVLADYMTRASMTTDDFGWCSWLAARSGLSHRTLAIMFGTSRPPRGEQRHWMKFATVDAAFARLGLTEIWHMPPEQGGLADLYEE